MQNKILDFLGAIGIGTIIHTDKITGNFFPKVKIINGWLTYNPDAIPSDILHEAGHIALVPFKYRSMCQADMGASIKAIWDKANLEGEIGADTYIFRALIQCSDPEATAWAWAAGNLLGIPEDQIIRDHDYNGEGKEIRQMLSGNCYMGINGLRAAGMIDSVRDFPKMKRWIQP